jgi:hypothetical protein
MLRAARFTKAAGFTTATFAGQANFRSNVLCRLRDLRVSNLQWVANFESVDFVDSADFTAAPEAPEEVASLSHKNAGLS